MSTQTKIPPTLAALHNFIMVHDPHDIEEWLSDELDSDRDPNRGEIEDSDMDFGMLSQSAVTPREKDRATEHRDQIANDMWRDYIELRHSNYSGL